MTIISGSEQPSSVPPIPAPTIPPAPPQVTPLDIGRTAQLFHNAAGDTYASIPVDGHRETYPLGSGHFSDWLTGTYCKRTNDVVEPRELASALNILQATAKFDGVEREVALRVAEHKGAYWVDLADKDWRGVRITDTAIEMVCNPAVKFLRPKGMLAHPVPVFGGSIELLRPFINVNDTQSKLLVGWLIGALRPQGPYPILELNGEQGSAKTTLSRMLRLLVDPNSAPVRSAIKNERDLAIAAQNGWCVVFDNVSSVSKAISDALCRISTGGGFSTRKLYSDGEEMLFQAKRPIILNGISEFVRESDLLSRSIILHLPRLEPGQRRDETELWASFEAARPEIFGALLKLVQAAHKNVPFVTKRDWPRLADFAKFVTAAEPALGWPDGTFLRALECNRLEADERVLENEPLTPIVVALAAKEWEGTATELLGVVSGGDARGLPQSANVLRRKLGEIAPNLRNVGVEVEFDREGSSSRKVIRISTSANNTARTDRIARINAVGETELEDQSGGAQSTPTTA